MMIVFIFKKSEMASAKIIRLMGFPSSANKSKYSLCARVTMAAVQQPVSGRFPYNLDHDRLSVAAACGHGCRRPMGTDGARTVRYSTNITGVIG